MDTYEFNSSNSFIKDLINETINSNSKMNVLYNQNFEIYIDTIIDKKILKNLNFIMKNPKSESIHN